MADRRSTQYRGGWTIESVWAGSDWDNTAVRGDERVEQGCMSYHSFILCLDRIDGRPCMEDLITGLKAGKSAADALVPVSKEEAWARAKSQAQGVPTPPVPGIEPAAPKPAPEPPRDPSPAPAAQAIQQSLFGEDWA